MIIKKMEIVVYAFVPNKSIIRNFTYKFHISKDI